MSGTGLKTYIKNVDCCLDDNYNMNFVLENPSDVREITWTLGFNSPWKGGGWLHKPNDEGVISNNDVIGERLLATSSDYKVIWNNGIITLAGINGKTIPSGSGDVLSFKFGDSSHLPIAEGESVIKIVRVNYVDINNVSYTIAEEVNTQINIRKANDYVKESTEIRNDDTSVVETTTIETTTTETTTTAVSEEQKEKVLVLIQKESATIETILSNNIITNKNVDKNQITIQISNNGGVISANSISLTLKDINHSEYSFSFDNGTNWKYNEKIMFPQINSNGGSSTVKINLHPDKINLAYHKKIDFDVISESNPSTPLKSDYLKIKPLPKNSQLTYPVGNDTNIVIVGKMSSLDIPSDINANANISLVGAKGTKNTLQLSNNSFPSQITSIKNLDLVGNTGNLNLVINTNNFAELDSVVVKGSITLSGQETSKLLNVNINKLTATNLLANHCENLSISNSVLKNSSNNLLSLSNCNTVTINKCEILESLKNGIHSHDSTNLKITNNNIDLICESNINFVNSYMGSCQIKNNNFNLINSDYSIKPANLADFKKLLLKITHEIKYQNLKDIPRRSHSDINIQMVEI